jgi:isoprenylcysteine carboxyl methyltransferase (ICMT) family protein YpbQ
MAQAPVTGPLALIFFATLMLLRIRVEERALGVRRG